MGEIRKGIEAEPGNIKNYIVLGKFYLEQNKYLEAIDVMNESLVLEPKNADIYYLLAIAHWMLGEKTEVIPLINKSIYFYRAIGNEKFTEKARLLLKDVAEANPSPESLSRAKIVTPLKQEDNEVSLFWSKGIDFVKASSLVRDIFDGKIRRWPEEHIIDDKVETHWCTADNVGEWAYIKLNKDYKLLRLVFINGNGFWSDSSEQYYADARIKDIEIEIANGWKRNVRLQDMGDWQSFGLGGRKTDYVKITILSLYPAQKWSHYCLSEIKIFAEK
ncbi:MAG: tetratricopeptide repeat protein [Candidatus Omnitrophica bacterium]|nr:tetratricopeptide repeat protein [Candidatus Omnitrophota bacterium]